MYKIVFLLLSQFVYFSVTAQVDRDYQFWRKIKGHTHWVHSLSFSDSDKYIFSFSEDAKILYSEVSNLKNRKIYNTHCKHIKEGAIINGPTLVTMQENKLKFWNIKNFKNPVKTFKIKNDKFNCMTVSEDGNYVAIGTLNGSVYIYTATFALLDSIKKNDNDIISLCFNNNSGELAVSSDSIRIWSMVRHQWKKTLVKSDRAKIIYSPEGSAIAYINEGQNILTITRVSDRVILLSDTCKSTAGDCYTLLLDLCYSPDGRYLAHAFRGKIYIYDLVNKCKDSITNIKNSYEKLNTIQKVKFSKDGRYLACNSENNVIVYNIFPNINADNIVNPSRPYINWFSIPSDTVTSDTNIYCLRARVYRTDNKSVKINFNGKNVVYKDDIFSNDISNEFDIYYYLTLLKGYNVLKITATNEYGSSTFSTKIIKYIPKKVDTILKVGEKRIAILIGNSNYNTGYLNSDTDIDSMEHVLKLLAFNPIIKIKDSSSKHIRLSIYNFGKLLEKNDVGLFFYAGHAIEVDGVNYLVPIDNILSKNNRNFLKECIPLSILYEYLRDASKYKIIMFDACRNNPYKTKVFTDTLSFKYGIFNNALISFSASQEQRANDGSRPDNSPYVASFLKEIRTNGVGIEAYPFFRNVSDDVVGKYPLQQPKTRTFDMSSNFYFIPVKK